jgi:hypothetical protein
LPRLLLLSHTENVSGLGPGDLSLDGNQSLTDLGGRGVDLDERLLVVKQEPEDAVK